MITFQNGTTLKCSENHPIMVIEKSGDVVQVYPDDLTTDHLVISEEGLTHLKSISNDQNSPNYIDITVADTHTFFAAHSKTAEMVLTHNSQGGVRGGSATIHTVFWHLEIEDLMVLKNNKGTDENRVRNMDYSILFNKVMYERLLTDGNITLFDPNDVREMYDAFFVNVDKFRDLYEAAEKNPKLRKKTVSALDLFSMFLQERKDTGRIYLMNVDHANDHGSFDKYQAPIKQSNLCLAGNTMVTVQLDNSDIKDMLLLEVVESTENYRIMSRNVKSGKDEFKKITARAKTGTNRKVMRITDTFGNSVVCTPEHQIYTKNRGYIEAKDLQTSDVLQLLK
jgi:hypothetical protein